MKASAAPEWAQSPLPDPAEILSLKPILPLENDISKPPGDKDHYAHVQYSILRHDSTELLRRAVNKFRDNPNMEECPECHIYDQAQFEGFIFASNGLSLRMTFTTPRTPEIVWETSPRLTTGTLVALSPISDAFKTKVYVTVVARRQLVGGLTPEPGIDHEHAAPRIDLVWRGRDDKDQWIMSGVDMYMIQAGSGMWEAVKYVMDGLQRWSLTPCRFDKYFIDCKGKPPSAPLFAAEPEINVKSLVLPRKEFLPEIIDLTAPFPKAFSEATGLDPTQSEAFRSMLTKEISIIQGPPGTGKTFTSVAALKILLENLQRGNCIVVAAQTNRALDQLLTHCLNLGAEIARVGARSRQRDIKKRTVRELLLNMKIQPKVEGMKLWERERKEARSKLRELIKEVYPEELLSPDQLHEAGLMTDKQLKSLQNNSDFSGSDLEFEGTDDENEERESEVMESNPLIEWLDNRGVIETPLRLDIQMERKSTPDDEIDVPDPTDEDGGLNDEDYDHVLFIRVKHKYTAKTDRILEETPEIWANIMTTLNKTSDLNKIPQRNRPFVFKYWQQQMVAKHQDAIITLLDKIQKLSGIINEARQKRNAKVINKNKCSIIGCTTTGLTKYRSLIEHLRPRILLIEEAAETREANLLACPLRSVEQLILVGDHKQLAPHADIQEMAKAPYHLSLSLFQRLVDHGVPYVMLGVQRRMTPSIRKLIGPFYGNLTDHPIVSNKEERPDVPGMGGLDTFWFHHTWAERLTSLKSRDNPTEGDMVVGMYRYLIQNGTPPDKITVLTFYTGQRRLISHQLATDRELAIMAPRGPFNVFTVDAFQGEENDVILLSLVRSPVQGARYAIGFLDDFRRTVVSLSRARRGLYIFGNYANFMYARNAAIAWAKPLEILGDMKRQGSKMPLVCQKHGAYTRVNKPEEFAALDGGCEEPCGELLPCGHGCPRLCHVYDHDKVPCLSPCEQVLACGHQCSRSCKLECACSDKCNKEKEMGKNKKKDVRGFGAFEIDLDERFEILEREAEEEEARERAERLVKEQKLLQELDVEYVKVIGGDDYAEDYDNNDDDDDDEEEDLICFSDDDDYENLG